MSGSRVSKQVDQQRMMRRFLARKDAELRAKRLELLAGAQAAASKIIDFIIKTYNPVRVYQWGSLVHTQRFTERSDIDIAVEGLEHPFDLHRIIDYAETVTAMPLDIVPLEELALVHAESIKRLGRLVYER